MVIPIPILTFKSIGIGNTNTFWQYFLCIIFVTRTQTIFTEWKTILFKTNIGRKQIKLFSYHFAKRRNNNISKCSQDMLERSGEKVLPPKENNLSTAALAGSPVLRVVYNCFMWGYWLRDDSCEETSAKYLLASSTPTTQSIFYLFVENAPKKFVEKSSILSCCEGEIWLPTSLSSSCYQSETSMYSQAALSGFHRQANIA